jgi:hypothetical protein
MQNITGLRESLTDNYEKMKKGEMPIKLGKELTNTAGKIIQSLKVELDYKQFMEDREPLPYLETK